MGGSVLFLFFSFLCVIELPFRLIFLVYGHFALTCIRMCVILIIHDSPVMCN